MLTLADYGPAVRALLDLMSAFPDLPEAYIEPRAHLSYWQPVPGLAIKVHWNGAHFEQWREALGLPQPDEDLDVYEDFQTVRTIGTWQDTAVELAGFLPLPLHDVPRNDDDGGADENARAAASAA